MGSEIDAQKPRVALSCLAGFAPSNGARVYLLALAQALARAGEVDLVLFTTQGESSALPPELRSLAYEVNVVPGRSYRQIFQAWQISRALQSARIELWHLPNTMPFFWRRTPAVITIHDVLDLKFRKYGFLRTVYRWIVNIVAAHMADKVITVSHNSQLDISKYLRIDVDKLVVVFPGVDETFCPGDGALSREMTAKQYGAEHFFLFPGGIARNKNIEVALHALVEFRRLGGVHSLVVTGEGSTGDTRSVRRLVRDLGLEECVFFTGSIPRDYMPTLYRAAAAVLYPSLYEGFGLPVLESMACGCPVVTSNTSSLPEVAGDAAILVNPRDPTAIAKAMHRVISDLALREVLIARGLERARSFSWFRTASETCDVYRAVLSRSRSKVAVQGTFASSKELS
jgi:glycosyltransferase involved in cell wall biosynthesis